MPIYHTFIVSKLVRGSLSITSSAAGFPFQREKKEISYVRRIVTPRDVHGFKNTIIFFLNFRGT